MQRIDSSTTLQFLIDDLADTRLTAAQRAAQVQAHVDVFVGAGDPNEVLARSRRLFNRATDLPPTWLPMRVALADTLVADAQARVPKMNHAVEVALVLDSARRLRRVLEAQLPNVAEQRVANAVTALCADAWTAYWLAGHLSVDCMEAFIQHGGMDEFRLLTDVEMSLQNFVRMATEQSEQIPPLRDAEVEGLQRAEYFVQSECPELLATLDILPVQPRAHAKLLLLREIVRQVSPEDMLAMATYSGSPQGRAYSEAIAPMFAALRNIIGQLSQNLLQSPA